MSFFVYSGKSEPKNGAIAPYETWKATDRYVEHYGNMLFLQAIVAAPKSHGERLQATKEQTICQRKLEFWERHMNFRAEEAQRRCEVLKKQWAQKR